MTTTEKETKMEPAKKKEQPSAVDNDSLTTETGGKRGATNVSQGGSVAQAVRELREVLYGYTDDLARLDVILEERDAIKSERAQHAEEIARLKDQERTRHEEGYGHIQDIMKALDLDGFATITTPVLLDGIHGLHSERDTATARAEKAEARVRELEGQLVELETSLARMESRHEAAENELSNIEKHTLGMFAPHGICTPAEGFSGAGWVYLKHAIRDLGELAKSRQSEVTRLTAALKEREPEKRDGHTISYWVKWAKELEKRVEYLDGQLNSKPCAAVLPVAIPETKQ